jgi:hypothetical protein
MEDVRVAPVVIMEDVRVAPVVTKSPLTELMEDVRVAPVALILSDRGSAICPLIFPISNLRSPSAAAVS